MLTMNPTLLVGPSDWDRARLPQEEFAERTAALWRSHPAAGGAIVYGDRVNHAELAYLTHFTPKLEAALALIPRTGAATLLVGGGANMGAGRTALMIRPGGTTVLRLRNEPSLMG